MGRIAMVVADIMGTNTCETVHIGRRAEMQTDMHVSTITEIRLKDSNHYVHRKSIFVDQVCGHLN